MWLVVDVGELPNLIGQIADRSIRRFTCTNCGNGPLPLNPSLLVGRPGQHPELMFAPDPEATAAQTQEQFRFSAHLLDRGWTGFVGQQEALIMPHDILATAVTRDVYADEDARRNRTLQALDARTQRYAQWLDARLTGTHHERLKAATVKLLEAPDDSQLRAIITEYPELLGEEAEALLTAMIDVTQTDIQPGAADTVRRRRLILRRVREHGLEQVLPAVPAP